LKGLRRDSCAVTWAQACRGIAFGGHPDSNPDTQELARLYCDEMLSLRDIADALGISFMTVYRRLRKMGVKVRGRG